MTGESCARGVRRKVWSSTLTQPCPFLRGMDRLSLFPSRLLCRYCWETQATCRIHDQVVVCDSAMCVMLSEERNIDPCFEAAPSRSHREQDPEKVSGDNDMRYTPQARNIFTAFVHSSLFANSSAKKRRWTKCVAQDQSTGIRSYCPKAVDVVPNLAKWRVPSRYLVKMVILRTDAR